jgi:5-methyltetrahydrofolate--homocysteine methyltransferase
MTADLTSAIRDARTPSVVSAVKATDLLLGHDEWGSEWIMRHRAAQAAQKAAAEAAAVT